MYPQKRSNATIWNSNVRSVDLSSSRVNGFLKEEQRVIARFNVMIVWNGPSYQMKLRRGMK